MTSLPWLRGLHILSMAVAFGANATYGVWIALAARGNDAQLAWVLRCLERVDTWVANGARWLAFTTGVALWWQLGLSLSTPWLSLSLALFIVAMAIAHEHETSTVATAAVAFPLAR